MDYATLIIQFLQGLGTFGVFVALIIVWKVGLLDFIKNWKKHTNGDIKASLEHHFEDDAKNFGEISESLTIIKENHLAHIQKDMHTMSTDIALTRQDNENIKDALRDIKRQLNEK